MKKELGSGTCEVKFHQLDITDQGSIDRLKDHVSSAHGGLDILVNNAGIAYMVRRGTPRKFLLLMPAVLKEHEILK